MTCGHDSLGNCDSEVRILSTVELQPLYIDTSTDGGYIYDAVHLSVHSYSMQDLLYPCEISNGLRGLLQCIWRLFNKKQFTGVVKLK